MLESMMDWLTLEFMLLKCDGRNIAGDMQYSEPLKIKGAREDKIVKIINNLGEYDLSTIQLYTREEDITTDDAVELDGITKPVKGVAKFYDFNDGTFSMAVIYL